MKALRLSIVLLAAWSFGLLSMLCLLHRFDPPDLPLVHASLGDCSPPAEPLLRSRQHNYDYRLGRPFNDKGVS